MKLEEVLWALREGKKIRREAWKKYDASKSNHYISLDSCTSMMCGGSHLIEDDWEVIPELVSFSTAWEAYEKGKLIKSEYDGETYSKRDANTVISIRFIRGKWEIL